MNWKEILAIIFLASILSSTLASSIGLSHWSRLESSTHAEIRLDSADQLLKFANVVNRTVVYSFDVFWPMKPGKTTLSAYVKNLRCTGKGYTIKIVTMDGKVFRAPNWVNLQFERKDPFLYFHVVLNVSSKCRVVPSKEGPVVVIDAKTK